MRLVTLIIFFLAFLSTFINVRATTLPNTMGFLDEGHGYFDALYDGSGFAQNRVDGKFIYNAITGGTTTGPDVITSGLTFGKFIFYSTTHVIFFVGSGNYRVYSKNTAGQITALGSATNIGMGCKNIFYFHPDPIVYIHHTEQPQKLYRYSINLSTGEITPLATRPSFDFGIGPLEYIERTESGFIGTGSSSTLNGFYQIAHISATYGRLLKKIPTYFSYPIVGLTYSPALRRFYVVSNNEISVWDIGNFLKPIFTRLETLNIIKASFFKNGQMGSFLINYSGNYYGFFFSVVEYSDLYPGIGAVASPYYVKTYSEKLMFQESYDPNLSINTFYLYTSNFILDKTCIQGNDVCLCDPKGPNPYIIPNFGVCSPTCPKKIYKRICVATCPSDSTENGKTCVPNYVCPRRCASCQNQQCVRCESNHYLYASPETEDGMYDICVHESVLDGFFIINDSKDGTGVVEACAPGCLECANRRKCFVCSS